MYTDWQVKWITFIMSFQAAEPTAHSNHTNWTGMAQGTLKAEVSKIRPGDQNQPDKESSLVHWMTLQIVKEGLNFWVFKCIFNKFSSFFWWSPPIHITPYHITSLFFNWIKQSFEAEARSAVIKLQKFLYFFLQYVQNKMILSVSVL